MPAYTIEKSITPMMRQYQEIKKKYPDCILFFRLGDFYEMFGEDALDVAPILNIALTSRNKNGDATPMCGVPYHAVSGYLSKLTNAGKKVALCEQLSDPNLPGIVERDVVKIITPGMTFDERFLDEKTNNYVVSIDQKGNSFGFSYIDVTTGEFFATEIDGFDKLEAELSRLNPKECVLNQSHVTEQSDLVSFLRRFASMFLYFYQCFEDQYEVLRTHFKTRTLDGFGLEDRPAAVAAAGFLFFYVRESQKAELSHVSQIRFYTVDRFMYLDEATLRNLELFRTLRNGKRQGSLLSVIDMTNTPMGARMLSRWLVAPLIDADLIRKRLEAVSELVNAQALCLRLLEEIKRIRDIERIVGKIGCGGGNARDLVCLRESLKQLPGLKTALGECQAFFLKEICDAIITFTDLVSVLDKALTDEPPMSLREGGLIKDDYHSELDEIRTISREGKSYITSLQEQEIKRTGIQSLKVKYNKVFGYYIEVTKPNLHLVPEDYIRKQTVLNGERFITPSLKEYEEKILHAEERMVDLEYSLFCELRDKVDGLCKELLDTAYQIARLDVFLSFSSVALKYGYVQPEIVEDDELMIVDGRHPVLERVCEEGSFVPNDVCLDVKKRVCLITGPNMAGKSTYLRQTALIVLLSQIGSFVPAKECRIGVVDRIFTRVGASDNLLKGQSTFMVEMHEASYILHHSTRRSLVILDEIGRGTSTYDGVSIAWAILEYLHDQIGAKTLFATHYHELIPVAERLEHAANFRVEVRENPQEGVVFLYKVMSGGSDRSYGIEVAKLAGLPQSVISKAQHILKELEEGVVEKSIQQHALDVRNRASFDQMNLFGASPELHPALSDLKNLDINRLTPLQALNTLSEIKKML